MRIIIVHNKYRIVGGEESVVCSETDLLRSNGHVVENLFRDNSEINSYGFSGRLKLFREAAWSRESFQSMRNAVRDFRADVVHIHNTHPLLSPSVFAAAHEGGAATVLTLHNFRLFCMKAVLFRDGQSCADCQGGGPWPGVVHRCYNGSLAGSVAMAAVIQINRQRGTWDNDVDAFIALTPENSKQTFIDAGLPADRIHLKPNFIQDPLSRGVPEPAGYGAVFIGHLVETKGIEMLLEAWRGLRYPLRVIGTGPLRDTLRLSAPNNVEFMGALPLSAVLDALTKSSFVVFPSTCRETFGRVIVEAFAMGRTVVASRHGAMAEIIRDRETGLLYEPGSVNDLRSKLQLLANDPELATRLGWAARREYVEKFTAEANYVRLMAIYGQALARRHYRSHTATRGSWNLPLEPGRIRP